MKKGMIFGLLVIVLVLVGCGSADSQERTCVIMDTNGQIQDVVPMSKVRLVTVMMQDDGSITNEVMKDWEAKIYIEALLPRHQEVRQSGNLEQVNDVEPIEVITTYSMVLQIGEIGWKLEERITPPPPVYINLADKGE